CSTFVTFRAGKARIREAPSGQRASDWGGDDRPMTTRWRSVSWWALLIFAVQPLLAQQVSVSPGSASLTVNQTQQFTATLTGLSGGVTWSINPSTSGTISTGGLYTAPSTINSQQTVTVTATSTANTSKSASATVTLKPISVTISPSSANVVLQNTQ